MPRAASHGERVGVAVRRPLRWGILGTGLIAGIFTSDLRASGLTVVAAGSRDRSSAERFSGMDLPTVTNFSIFSTAMACLSGSP